MNRPKIIYEVRLPEEGECLTDQFYSILLRSPNPPQIGELKPLWLRAIYDKNLWFRVRVRA